MGKATRSRRRTAEAGAGTACRPARTAPNAEPGPAPRAAAAEGSTDRPDPPADKAVSELELFIFRELPGELRYLLALTAELPQVVAHAAEGVSAVLREVAGDSPAAQLQRSAVQLRSHAEQIQRAANDLLVLAGRVQGLAWASWAGEQAGDAEAPST